MSEWETFCDESYYSLWRVRRKNERGFNDGYHIHNGEEARALVELLNGHERELDAERALAEMYRRKCSRMTGEHKALQEQLNASIMLGKMQERRHERELEQVREQYRLSSVCRELKSENEKLKALLDEKEASIQRVITWPHDDDPFTSPDHDNDQTIYQ